MKRYVIILGLILFTVMGFSQRVVTDTLNAADTVYFTQMLDAKQVTVTATNLGGTSDGTLIFQGSSNGTNYATLTSTSGMFAFFPADTMAVTDGAVWIITIKDTPLSYFRVVGYGTASDTTLITIDWSKR